MCNDRSTEAVNSEKKLRKLKQINAADESLEKLLILEAAQMWRRCSLMTADVDSLQKGYLKLEEHNHLIPLHQKILYTSRVAKEFQQNRRFEDWISTVLFGWFNIVGLISSQCVDNTICRDGGFVDPRKSQGFYRFL